MSEQKPRFCASVIFGSHIIKGCGTTLEEAREDLIREIWRDETLFTHEKTHLIRQIQRLSEQKGAV